MIPLHQQHAQAPPAQQQQHQQTQTQQQSASQLSGMGPSQLLLASQGPNAAGSVFLPGGGGGASQAQPAGSQETLQAGGDSGAAHREVSKPQVWRSSLSLTPCCLFRRLHGGQGGGVLLRVVIFPMVLKACPVRTCLLQWRSWEQDVTGAGHACAGIVRSHL
jgi:hypothetical protein